jgi:hypothetical protein
MNSQFSPQKISRLYGCMVVLFIFGLPCALLYYHSHKQHDYYDSEYRKDYQWNDLEVGIIQRIPRGNPLPTGRYYAVIVFPTNQISEARIVLDSPKGETPKIPRFISGKENQVTYDVEKLGQATVDLNQWMEYPRRDNSSRDKVH